MCLSLRVRTHTDRSFTPSLPETISRCILAPGFEYLVLSYSHSYLHTQALILLGWLPGWHLRPGIQNKTRYCCCWLGGSADVCLASKPRSRSSRNKARWLRSRGLVEGEMDNRHERGFTQMGPIKVSKSQKGHNNRIRRVPRPTGDSTHCSATQAFIFVLSSRQAQRALISRPGRHRTNKASRFISQSSEQ